MRWATVTSFGHCLIRQLRVGALAVRTTESFTESTVLRPRPENVSHGRRREHHRYFASAEQSSTRAARIEKYAPKFLDGEGF